MKRPPTEVEAKRERVLRMWALALLVGRMYPKDIRGSSRWTHDNTAGSACYGMKPHIHVHYFTNHRQPINGEIAS